VLTLARRRCAGGERALLIAAKAGREDLVELLADFKADLDAGNALGRTALHQASQEGHLAVVQVLLKVGADVEAKDRVSLKSETLTHA
jgi:ankyrin repeat protein